MYKRYSMFKILQTHQYTVNSIFLPSFPTFVLFTLILNIPALILQALCCHAVMKSKVLWYVEAHWEFLLAHVQFCEMNNRFVHAHNYFPSEGDIKDLMVLYQYKKISLYRKNASVVLQVLQKILSLLTSRQECRTMTHLSPGNTGYHIELGSCTTDFRAEQTRVYDSPWVPTYVPLYWQLFRVDCCCLYYLPLRLCWFFLIGGVARLLHGTADRIKWTFYPKVELQPAITLLEPHVRQKLSPSHDQPGLAEPRTLEQHSTTEMLVPGPVDPRTLGSHKHNC